MTGSETPNRRYAIDGHSFEAPPLETGLYIVSTPIGNLRDVTLRALQVLAAADLVACEDTRVTRVLLNHYGISASLLAYHEHNAEEQRPRLLAALEDGKSVALVSDAGTPLVSDPGYRLATLAIEAGFRVVPLPGASAPLAALVGSGLPNDAFLFAGFLPHKDKAKRDRFAELAAIPSTLIYFDSPHRIGDSLVAAAQVLGTQRRAAVCRELTKTFEEFRRGTLGELAAEFAERTVKGEIVLVIAPPDAPPPPEEADVDALLSQLSKDMPAGKAATEAARLSGLPRKDLYRRLLDMKGNGG